MKVAVDVDVRGTIEALRKMYGDVPDKAIPQALNRTLRTVRARTARAISAETGGRLAINVVRKRLTYRNATKVTLTATLTAQKGSASDLDKIRGATWQQDGAGVTVTVGDETYRVPHAFINKRKGRLGPVLLRAPQWGAQILGEPYDYRAKRLARHGPDYPVARIRVHVVPLEFVKQKIQMIMRDTAYERFPIDLNASVRHTLGIV